MIVAWLLKNWRLIAYAVAAAAVAGFLLLVLHWRNDSVVELPAVQEKLQAEMDCTPESQCGIRVAKAEAVAREKQRIADQEVLSGYEAGLKAVADYAAAHPAPSVRLCRSTREPAMRLSDTSSPADGAAPGGDVPLQAGADIGQQLFDLADDADRQAVTLRSLQEWNRSLAGE